MLCSMSRNHAKEPRAVCHASLPVAANGSDFFFFFSSVEIKNGYFCELFVMLPIVFHTENFAWRLLYTYINLLFFFSVV